jgi:drug/metabolite transporter (DMT)-like permease
VTSKLLTTSEGTTDGAFSPLDWALLAAIAGTWGASFLLMAIGLDHFAPGAITLGRVGFGAIILNLLPGARHHFDRSDYSRIVLLAVIWIATPLTLFPIAQQWIDSSVAGMLNAATPVLTALVATLMLQRPPGTKQRVGIVLGFCGVILVSAPTIDTGNAAWLGVVLVIGATACYAMSINIVAPLQQRHGSLPVLARVQALAAVLVLPYGAWGVRNSSFDWGSLAAVAVLGVAGTGLAYVAFGTLIGRVGGTRASVVTYQVPVVAVMLGVTVRDEPVAALALVGCGLVLTSAFVSSQSGR